MSVVQNWLRRAVATRQRELPAVGSHYQVEGNTKADLTVASTIAVLSAIISVTMIIIGALVGYRPFSSDTFYYGVLWMAIPLVQLGASITKPSYESEARADFMFRAILWVALVGFVADFLVLGAGHFWVSQ